MKRFLDLGALLRFLPVCLAVAGLMIAEAKGADGPIKLEVNEKTPKLEVRYSQIGFRDTLQFYTFSQQKAVLKLQFGNQDKTFPVTGQLYLFADGVTEEDLKKWLNNQHSDGLFADIPEPIATHKLPAMHCKTTSHKFIDHSKEPFGEYDNYAVKFQVSDYSEVKNVVLKGFVGETKVHLKTK